MNSTSHPRASARSASRAMAPLSSSFEGLPEVLCRSQVAPDRIGLPAGQVEARQHRRHVIVRFLGGGPGRVTRLHRGGFEFRKQPERRPDKRSVKVGKYAVEIKGDTHGDTNGAGE